MNDRVTRTMLARLLGRAGQAAPLSSGRPRSVRRAGGEARPGALLEALENRVLLGGDPPGLISFPAAEALTLDGAGQATFNETVASNLDDDVYSFTFAGPAADFVSVLADTTTTGSTLDSRVEVYVQDGAAPNGRRLVASGSNNGVISATAPLPTRDGWAGFLATPGTTYFVRVLGDNGSTGTYQLRVDAQTTPIAPVPTATGEVGVPGTVGVTQGEVIFRVTAPSDDAFDSIATAVAEADFGDFDTHLEVYDAAGNLVVSDIQSGYITSAFVAWKSDPDATFYIRVRGDELSGPTATGAFTLRVDLRAKELDQPMSAITRRGLDETGVLVSPHDSDSYRFVAQGTGVVFVTAQDFTGSNDLSLRVYDTNGVLLAFEDDFVGRDPEVQVRVVGGERYFVVVDGFDLLDAPFPIPGGPYGLYIEAHSTFDSNIPIDDHLNTPGIPTGELTPAQREALMAQFEQATPLIFNAPRLYTADGNPGHTNGNPVRDHSYVVDAVGTGRIYQQTDVDLFMFHAPLDMLGEYRGNNDDAGTGLFVGGAFQIADAEGLLIDPDGDPNTAPHRVTSRNLALWDAADWWWVGPQATPFGFANNPATPATPGAEVYAMLNWDPDGGGPLAPRLVVGGDFNLNIPGPGGVVTLQNIAQWVFNPLAGKYVWASLGDAGAPVRALAVFDPVSYDPDGNGPAPTLPDPGGRGLIAGGDFTTIGGVAANRIASLSAGIGGFAWNALGAGVNAPVHALTLYDPLDPGAERPASPGPPAVGLVADVPDYPLSLAVGGAFTSADGNANISKVGLWTGVEWIGLGEIVSPTFGPYNATINGTVFALANFDPPDPDGTGPAPDPDPELIIGGDFTSVNRHDGPIAASRLVRWGILGPDNDPQDPAYDPLLTFEEAGSGANDTVFAMAVWDPPDVAGDIEPVLAIGGAFTDLDGSGAQRVGFWDGAAGGALGQGMNNTVRSLVALVDDQEPGIPLLGGDLDPQEVLYAGGFFTTADGDPANRVAQFAFDPGLGAFVWTALNGGTDGPVFALANFDDQNPQFDNSESFWDRNDRPATRVSMAIAPTFGSFLNTRIRMFDSNLNLIYTNNTIAPAPDPSGSIDPAISAAQPQPNTQLVGPPIWAGETYYIEVRSETQGFRNTGRYNIRVTVDAVPPDTNNDGQPDDVISDYFETTDAGDWANAAEIVVDDNAVGNGDIFGQVADNFPPQIPITPVTGEQTRFFDIYPSLKFISQAGDQANIETITDTDLWYFRANADGTAEIRVNTTALTPNISDPDRDPNNYDDQFAEREWDLTVNPPTAEDRGQERQYNSLLDSVVRIFNADLEQIFVSDTNPAVAGRLGYYEVGDQVRPFRQRDGRVVIPITRGQIYFIQVESGQLAAFNTDPSLVDWRYATGSYEVMVHTMPDFDPDFDDDHAGGFPETAIPIATAPPARPGDAPNGQGSITGRIDNTFFNPDDVDSFKFISPTRGTVNVTISATEPGSVLRLSAAITTALGNVAAGSTPAGGSVTLTFLGQKGQTYFIDIDGVSTTEGAYRIDVVTQPFVDDHADIGKWHLATVMPVSGFFGSATASGRLEGVADTDTFTFVAPDFDVARVTVTPTSSTLDPVVRVYEINADARGNLQLYPIALNDDAQGLGAGSRVTFSVTAGRPYYISVEGVNPYVDFGNYNLVVDQLSPTDDHPNLADLPSATPITIVYDPINGTGAGTETGAMQDPVDDDLFSFVAPASGNAVITVTADDPAENPHVELRDASGVLIAGANGAGGVATLVANNALVAGQTYFIDVTLQGALGGYTVDVVTSPVDDHADAGEWNLATGITLSASNGVGVASGVILPLFDTDLFTFDTVAPGTVILQLTTPDSTLNSQLTVFNASFNQVAFSQGNADSVTITFAATAAGQRFFVLVEPDALAAGTTQTGSYVLRVQGSTGGGGGGGGGVPGEDDHANAGEFPNATLIGLDQKTGDGSAFGFINFLGDSDLFTFTTQAAGPVRIQVVAPSGSQLDASVRVFDAGQNEIRFDTLGIPGATASTSFDAAGTETYYLLVEQVGPNVGSYTVRVDTEPQTHFLYYPEGFSSSSIDEFVPLVNPNGVDVSFTVIARYEVGVRDQVIATGSVPANSRGGITISSRSGSALVRRDEPYALEIRSDGQLGATLSHYDFGVTTGENFTPVTANVWTFAEANRDPAVYRDFLIFYNPNDGGTTVTVELFYDDGTVVSFDRSLAALRRGGVNFNDDLSVPKSGRFSVRVSAPVPIVAALSSYDIANGRGYGLLGSAGGGATEGVVPFVTAGGGVESSVAIFNDSASPATVTLVATYLRVDLPELVRVFNVPAGGRVSVPMTQLGLSQGQAAGLKYFADTPVTVNYREYQFGDGDASATATHGITTGIIGDAFVNPSGAGITYIERLNLFNPTGVESSVQITYLFTDGTTAVRNVTIAPGRFSIVAVDAEPAILNRVEPTAFSIRLDSSLPFVAGFIHYDLFLAGGWSTLASPIGLTNELSLI